MNKNIILIAVLLLFFGLALLEPNTRSFISSPFKRTTTTTLEEKQTYAREEKGIPAGRLIKLTLSQATDLSGFSGKVLTDHAFLGQYGSNASQTLRDYSIILGRIQRLKPGFSRRHVEMSDPSKVVWLKDERQYLMLSGRPLADSSTSYVIAFEPLSGRVYLLEGNSLRNKIVIYGSPDKEVLALLTHYFLREL